MQYENTFVQYYVYILASKRRGTLYTGVTNHLIRRGHEHREGLAPGFTRNYGVKTLVYLETFGDIRLAIEREKQLKKWRRDWKIALIEDSNPDWVDLFPGLVQ